LFAADYCALIAVTSEMPGIQTQLLADADFDLICGIQAARLK
jgi:hypothetical protein